MGEFSGDNGAALVMFILLGVIPVIFITSPIWWGVLVFCTWKFWNHAWLWAIDGAIGALLAFMWYNWLSQ